MNNSIDLRKVLNFLLTNLVFWMITSFMVQIAIYFTFWYMLPFEMCAVITAVLYGACLVFARSFLIILVIIRDVFRILIQFRKPYKNGRFRSPIVITKLS